MKRKIRQFVDLADRTHEDIYKEVSKRFKYKGKKINRPMFMQWLTRGRPVVYVEFLVSDMKIKSIEVGEPIKLEEK